MQIQLITIGQGMPAWVNQGVAEYAKRMPRYCRLNLIEIPAQPRPARADLARIARDEGARMLQSVAKHATLIALTRDGQSIGTPALASRMQRWIDDGDDVALLVGGPEGLHHSVLDEVTWSWSLSPLTFAHPLVRVIVAEQLYRAWSVIEGKPYHRGE